MKLLCLACAVALASGAALYQVDYVASSDRVSYSNGDNVELKLLRNTSGTVTESEWENLGQAFVRGVSKTQWVSVDDVTGVPTAIQVRAQDWNGLNFISVSMGGSSDEVVQFKTDFFDDESPSRAPHNSNNIFQYDQVYTSSAGAPVPNGTMGSVYVVSWKTGYSSASSSSSPMYVQFHGSNGYSRYYLLDDVFEAGHVNEASIGVLEDIGDLEKIELLAGGPDSWNPVNFIEVRTPTAGEVVQFQADVMLDQLPPYDGANAPGTPYRHAATYRASAINVEGSANLQATPLEYQATFQTGMETDGASSSDQFVQLIGAGGARSNYVKLGDSFTRGTRTVVDMAIMHDIGQLEKIRLRAGGRDSWLVVGDFSVKTPNDVLVHFQTDLYMDEKPHDVLNNGTYGAYPVFTTKTLTSPHPQPPNPCTTRGEHNCCGNGICDAQEDVGNCAIDCKNSGWNSYAWGAMENENVTTQADAPIEHPAVSWENAAHFSLNGTVTNIDHTNTAATAPTIAATTAAPYHQSCNVSGRATPLPHGWTMAGTEENYCNYCKCSDGAVTCTHKICGYPFQDTNGDSSADVPAGWELCPNNTVTCDWNDATKRVSVRSKMQLNELRRKGGKHRCAYNDFTGNCTCYCKLDKVDYAVEEVGTFDFSDTGFDGLSCRSVPFAKGGFDPDLGEVTVVASASYSYGTDTLVHDAPAVWVEQATHTAFMACAREDKKHWRSHDNTDHRLQLEYYAFQRNRVDASNNTVHDDNKPFPGAQGNVVKVTDMNNFNTGGDCLDVPFRKSFAREPIVVGTVDYDTTFVTGSRAVTHWLERVSTTKFRVCFRETYHTPSGGAAVGDNMTEPFNFNWMAVEDRNAELVAANRYRYSAAGMASSRGTWTDAKDDTGAVKDAGNVQHACKWLSYGQTFTSKPTVLVESKHNAVVSGQAVVDWATQYDAPAVITFVNQVETTRFQVCASTLHRSNKAADETLQWNWIAFGPAFQSSTAH